MTSAPVMSTVHTEGLLKEVVRYRRCYHQVQQTQKTDFSQFHQRPRRSNLKLLPQDVFPKSSKLGHL